MLTTRSERPALVYLSSVLVPRLLGHQTAFAKKIDMRIKDECVEQMNNFKYLGVISIAT